MKIIIERTNKTPRISESDNNIYIDGILTPENPIEIFKKINNIINQKSENCNEVNLNINLEYFNTSSAKFLYDTFMNLNKEKLRIIWNYESDDEDIYESGKEFEEMTNLNFIFNKK